MKLQKLLYYVQAWSLAWRDEPMFPEEIEAWQYGPVIEPIYQEYKHFGYDPITEPESGNASALTADEMSTLVAVVEEYWKLAGTTLADLTHSEPPWVEARKGLPDDARSRRVISKDSIKRNYRAYASFGHPSRSSLIKDGDPLTAEVIERGSGEALQALIERTLGVKIES